MFQSTPPRSRPISRSVLGFALAAGAAVGLTAGAAPALAQKQAQPSAPKLKLSKGFQSVAAGASKSIEAARAKPEAVQAKAALDAANAAARQASGTAARQQAAAQVDAARQALGATYAAERSQLDSVFAAVANEDDRYMAGNLAVSLGGMMQDQGMQRRGLESMLQSGKVAPTDTGRFRFFIGQIAFQQGDYAAARTAFQEAMAGGYRENDIEALFAEAYFADNQTAQGLTVLSQAIAARKGTASPAPMSWYRRGLAMAYKGKLLDKASEYAMSLVSAYPSTDNWSGAVAVVREIGKFPSQETLDLMRLMGRTNSYAEERDFIEYIQAADARRFPGEVLKVIEQGTAAGKLRAADPFVTESRSIASQRVAADRASLGALERDANAAKASSATTAGAADAFLSYGDAEKAAGLYASALAKPGADADRINTRLGIALVDLGKYTEAQTAFAKVGGTRKAIAQLWSIYAGQKAAGG